MQITLERIAECKDKSPLKGASTYDIFIETGKKTYRLQIPNGLSEQIQPWSFYRLINSDQKARQKEGQHQCRKNQN